METVVYILLSDIVYCNNIWPQTHRDLLLRPDKVPQNSLGADRVDDSQPARHLITREEVSQIARDKQDVRLVWHACQPDRRPNNSHGTAVAVRCRGCRFIEKGKRYLV